MKTELKKAQDYLTSAAGKLGNDHPAGGDVLGAMMALARMQEQLADLAGVEPAPKPRKGA